MSLTILKEDKDDDDDINRKPAIDNWLLVKYTTAKRFVRQVLNISQNILNMKTA